MHFPFSPYNYTMFFLADIDFSDRRKENTKKITANGENVGFYLLWQCRGGLYWP
jgi:hypothetical protein